MTQSLQERHDYGTSSKDNEADSSLVPGFGFFLEPTGKWSVKVIPPEVVKSATFSGYLTINGYRSTVFETPDGDQWGQKSVNTVASVAVRVATTEADW